MKGRVNPPDQQRPPLPAMIASSDGKQVKDRIRLHQNPLSSVRYEHRAHIFGIAIVLVSDARTRGFHRAAADEFRGQAARGPQLVSITHDMSLFFLNNIYSAARLAAIFRKNKI